MSGLFAKTSGGCRGRCLSAVIVALVSLIAIGVALWNLTAARDGLIVTPMRVGSLPLTVFRPSRPVSAPAVVIAHGFAGSQQLMQPYATTLARNGYVVVTFDFPGHGRNPAPFVSTIMDPDKRRSVLLKALEPAVETALSQPGVDGRLALVGHSMAGDVLASYARAHPGRVSATVLLSPYLAKQTDTLDLSDLLLIYGGLEPEMLHREGLKVLRDTLGTEPRVGVTYGSLAQGTGRRMVLADGVEHIGILYSGTALRATLDWLDRAFGRQGSGFIDQRGGWLGLLYLGLVGLAWPLARLLPVVASRPAGAGLGWRRLLAVAAAPAILTPLILWRMPTHFLPVLIGDYLALHFLVYGAITSAGLWLMRRRMPARLEAERPRVDWRRFIAAALAVTLYFTLAFGAATDRFVTNFQPGQERVWILAAMLVGTLSYFTADAWLTRGEGAARGASLVTKLLFLLSLLLAVLLNLRELFFLIIIVPAILVLFVVFGLMSAWVYRRTRHPWVGAVANAAVFAVAVSVTFPVVGA